MGMAQYLFILSPGWGIELLLYSRSKIPGGKTLGIRGTAAILALELECCSIIDGNNYVKYHFSAHPWCETSEIHG